MKGMRPLSDEEILKILDGFKGRHALRNKALFILGVKTGFRISELLSLKVKDVQQFDIMRDTVEVPKRNTKGKIESKSKPLHREASRILEELIRTRSLNPSDYIFKSQKGNNRHISRNQAWTVFDNVFADLKIQGRKGTHCMRKTFAQKVYNRLGGDLLKTQKALGHKNIDSTVSYLSFAEKEIDDAILDL